MFHLSLIYELEEREEMRRQTMQLLLCSQLDEKFHQCDQSGFDIRAEAFSQ